MANNPEHDEPPPDLALEPRETLALLEARKLATQRAVWATARSYRGRNWFSAIMPATFMALWLLENRWGYVIAAFGMWIVFDLHVAGLNRRIDALLQVLEHERKPPAV